MLATKGDTTGTAGYRIRALRDGQAVRIYSPAGRGNVSLLVGNVHGVYAL